MFTNLIAFGWNTFFKLRQKLFGYRILIGYLPDAIEPIMFPMHMDLFWWYKGFIGHSEFFVPKGNLHSDRFDENSPYFQTWLGTYYITTFSSHKFHDDIEILIYLTEAALQDQRGWLKIQGAQKSNTNLIPASIRKLENKDIFYGEIETQIDDYIKNKPKFKFIIKLFARIAMKFNNKTFSEFLLIPDDEKTQSMSSIKLFGFAKFKQISDRKYALSYVCGTMGNKEKIENELM